MTSTILSFISEGSTLILGMFPTAICIRMYVATVYAYVRTYVHTYVHVSYVRMYVRIRSRMYLMYVRTYTYTYVRTYVRTYVHAYVRSLSYVCVPENGHDNDPAQYMITGQLAATCRTCIINVYHYISYV
jgi:hypothetical protein